MGWSRCSGIGWATGYIAAAIVAERPACRHGNRCATGHAVVTRVCQNRQLSPGMVARMGQSVDSEEVVMSVRQRADGYWYIGQGRSIAEGPYRHPQQLLAVASDLLAAHAHWRIDVFDCQGTKIV